MNIQPYRDHLKDTAPSLIGTDPLGRKVDMDHSCEGLQTGLIHFYLDPQLDSLVEFLPYNYLGTPHVNPYFAGHCDWHRSAPYLGIFLQRV
jgi:hypothetical protein